MGRKELVHGYVLSVGFFQFRSESAIHCMRLFRCMLVRELECGARCWVRSCVCVCMIVITSALHALIFMQYVNVECSKIAHNDWKVCIF